MLSIQDGIIFDTLTSHLSPGAKNTVLNFITDIPGVTFDLLADDYILNPDQAIMPATAGWEPGYLGYFRWGNWVGPETGAKRYSDHTDFTTSESSIAARDVFDAIGRVHDLKIDEAREVFDDAVDQPTTFLDKLDAAILFLEARSDIDLQFSIATEALGIRDGLIGYEEDIRELSLAIMQWNTVGYSDAAENMSNLAALYPNFSTSQQMAVEDSFDLEDFLNPSHANVGIFSAALAFLGTYPPTQKAINNYAVYWEAIYGDQQTELQLIPGYSIDRSRERVEYLNQFKEIYGAEGAGRLAKAINSSCFVAGTEIAMWNGSNKRIEDIRQEDVVVAFDEKGKKVPGYVDKLFTNTTTEFYVLNFANGGRQIVTTPGHRFLTETGDYMEIGHMLKLGGGSARIVNIDGSIEEVAGELVVFSAETSHLFPKTNFKTLSISGNTVLKEHVDVGWQTFNFEVRTHHNYVAGGVRVHNDSVLNLLQPEDELVALSEDMRDAIVVRTTGTSKSVILLNGYEDTNGTTSLAETVVLNAAGIIAGIDLEAKLLEAAGTIPLGTSQPELVFNAFKLLVIGSTTSIVADVSVSGLSNPIDGTSSGQTWSGNATDEWYRGNGGNDLIKGNNGNDLLEGGLGRDNIRGGNDDDIIYGGAENDKLYGDAGADLLYGGGGNDKLYGNDGMDELSGGAGNDRMEGGDYSDVLYGGDGDDIIYTGSGSFNEYGIDKAWGGAGNDNMIGSNGGDTLYGEAGNDILTGGQDYASADRGYLYGGDGDDIISSGQTSTPNSSSQAKGDTMFGDAGNDTIISGKANDELTGGTGADTFVFDDQYGRDVVTDFKVNQTNEVIDLSAVGAITNGTSYQNDFDAFKTAHLSETSGNAVIFYDNNNKITLESVSLASLSGDDFIF